MTLFLVDGHAIAYRSHFAFAKNPLTNSKGMNTSAVFGFTRLLIQLMNKYSPELLAVVFDCEEETARHEEYPEYKAQREEMPDELSEQLAIIVDLLEAFGVRVEAWPGYEADDVIGTLARKAEKSGIDVKIVSSDKDLFQLLSDRVHMIRPGKGTSLADEIDPRYLEERFGLRAEQMVDLLAIMGDSSDNIPGVRGIGEKTALKLLHEFGSLDRILECVHEIEQPGLRKKLEEGSENALFSRRLVTLMDVPIDFSPENLKVKRPDREALTEILLELEFHQIIRELSIGGDGRGDSRKYTVVRGEDLEGLVESIRTAGETVLDVETTSLDPLKAELVGISFCFKEGEAWYVPVETASAYDDGSRLFEADPEETAADVPLDAVRSALDPILSDGNIGKIGHNIKYDLLVLESNGFEVNGITRDTMIASYCLDSERRSHSLDNLALDHYHYTMISYKNLFPDGDKRRDIRTVPLEKLAHYSCEDADYTFRLDRLFSEELKQAGFEKLYEEVEMPLCLILKDMEKEGVAIDTEALKGMSAGISGELKVLESKIHEQAGERFNVNSNKQLQHILFEKLGLSSIRKTKTGYSTDMAVLGELAGEHPIAELVLEYRQLSKLLNTYIDALPRLVNAETGRVHTSFNQTVTATGRLSSSDPNLQNIPIRTERGRLIRSAFVPRGGNILMDADYSQIELRIMAHLSRDKALIEAFNSGKDVHGQTAAKIYGVDEDEVDAEMRARAKTINFGVMYGMGARGLANQLGISIDEAKEFIGEYFENHPGVMEYTERAVEQARERGYAETLLGRRRLLHEIDSGNGRARSFSERIAVNMPIQGTAADLIKVAMIGIDDEVRRRGLGARMIIQVHDELVFDVPEEESGEMEELIGSIMESAMDLEVPLRVDIGRGNNWLEAHR